jgi:hypothetical protein
MVFLMLFVNIKRGKSAGIAAAFAFSLFGFLLNPQLFKQIFELRTSALQSQRGGRVALAAQSGDLPHAQFRLRPAAAALANVCHLRNCDCTAVCADTARAAQIQFSLPGGDQ